MLGAIKSAIDVALQGQGSRLVGMAEAYKQRTLNEVDAYKTRTLNEVKQHTISAGITVALVATALAFLLMAVMLGLASLFYWVAIWHGTLAGLGVAGVAAMFLALVLIAFAAMRTGKSQPASPAYSPPTAVPARAQTTYPAVTAGVTDNNAAALGRKTVDAASGIMRDGSREAVVATLVATVVIGVLLGRKR